MATISAGDLTKLRDKKHSSKFYLSVLKPTTFLSALVNDGTISRGDRSIAYDNGSGSGFSDIESGQTLWIGTTAGDNDIGKVRIKSITGSQTSGTITVAENYIDWGDNVHLTVLHNYEIWAIPAALRSNISYKDFDITWSDQTTSPPPVAIGGPHQAGFLSGGSLVLNVPVADSYVVADGAAISTKTVSVTPSSGVTVGAESGGVIPITYTATGTYWVKTTATDDNSKSQDTYRVHFVYDSSTLPYNDFSVSNINGDWNSGGYSFDVEVYGDAQLSDFPDGTVVLLWREGRIDDTEDYVNIWAIGDNIICAGYLRRDNATDDLTAGDGVIRFSVDTPDGILANRSIGGTESIEAVSSPSAWYEYASWMTVGRAVHWYLKWHSTVLETCDIYSLLDNTLGVRVGQFHSGTLLNDVNQLGFERGIFAKIASDRLGRLHFVEDIQMFNETNRDAEDTIFSITKQDLASEVNLARSQEGDLGFVLMEGSSFDGTTETALTSMIGGYFLSGTPTRLPQVFGGGSSSKQGQVLNSQADANEKVGRVMAKANNLLSELRVPLRADYLGAFDIIPSLGWYDWTISDNELKRNLSLNGKKALCRRVQNRISVSAGTIETNVILEIEAEGPDGIISDFPTDYPSVTLPEPNWTLPTGATYGYFAGGVTGPLAGDTVATADRITFSTGSTAANTDSDLSSARTGLAGLSDTDTYGYFAGGATSGTDRVATADRLTFSTGVTAANTDSDLSEARGYLGAVSDSDTYGYFAGGVTGTTTEVATADRITFSTGVTAANTDSDLSANRQQMGALSDNTTYGYFAGGFETAEVATADRLTFSTGVTAANTDSDLSSARRGVMGVSDTATYGYFLGGNTGSGNVVTADRITFSTGVTAANTDSDLSEARQLGGGLSDGDTYGYVAGGSTGAVVATADRITFSTGVTAANTDSDLSEARNSLAALSDGNVS